MGLFSYPSEVALHRVFSPRLCFNSCISLKVWVFNFILLKQQLIQVSELGAEVPEGLLYLLRAVLLNTVAISHCRGLHLN